MENHTCPHCGKKIYQPSNNKDDKIKQLQEKFYDSLVNFVPEYGRAMIREFYEYWTEPNKSKTKIKWQLEKTWDTNRRLKRWKRNNFNNEKDWSNNKGNFKSNSTQRTIERIQNGFEQEG